MHEETGIDLVTTNDVHYTRAEDADPHDILLCLQTNKKLADEDRMRYEGGQYYVKSPEEWQNFSHMLWRPWRILIRLHRDVMLRLNLA